MVVLASLPLGFPDVPDTRGDEEVGVCRVRWKGCGQAAVKRERLFPIGVWAWKRGCCQLCWRDGIPLGLALVLVGVEQFADFFACLVDADTENGS
jgi:hypothetical protein